MPRKFHLGHFIKERHIEKALILLRCQLQQQSPLYNNLDFTIYRNKGVENIEPTAYYNEYIKRDSMYYFEDLFYAKKYFSVQRAYKIREFHYLSLHAIIIYYAIGFYLNELLEKKIAQNHELYLNKNIHVYYGGKLNFAQPEKSKIFYYEDYKDFLTHKEALTNPEMGKTTFAISLDIKSFFYTINHKILLDLVDDVSSPTIKRSLNYDEDTKGAIATLFNYFQGSTLGLPVANQNIISSFLSSIYFSSFDEFIIDKYLNTGRYSYIRYVDDFYLIFKDEIDCDTKTVRKEIYDIENDFAEFLMNKLQLSISTSKSDRYEIKDTASQIDFLKSSGLDSPFDQEFDFDDLYEKSVLSIEIKEKTIPDVFLDCIEIIKRLKEKTFELSQLDISTKESAYLNHILILKACLAYSKSPAAFEIINEAEIFDDIDSIDYLLIKPKVLLHLSTTTSDNREKLFQFITSSLKSPESLLPKLTLVDKFIHQMFFLIIEANGETKTFLKAEFDNYKIKLGELLLQIKSSLPDNSYLELILNVLYPEITKITFTKIYSAEFLNMDLCISLTQQIKLRRLNENNLNYTVSFNHLLNEFQNLFELTYFNSEQKTSKEITKKMSEEKFKSNQVTFITNFFDRRNQNSISHTNTNDIGLWGVSYNEYMDYKVKLAPILELIFKKRSA